MYLNGHFIVSLLSHLRQSRQVSRDAFSLSLALLLLLHRLGHFSQDPIHCTFALLDVGSLYNDPYIHILELCSVTKSPGKRLTLSSL